MIANHDYICDVVRRNPRIVQFQISDACWKENDYKLYIKKFSTRQNYFHITAYTRITNIFRISNFILNFQSKAHKPYKKIPSLQRCSAARYEPISSLRGSSTRTTHYKKEKIKTKGNRSISLFYSCRAEKKSLFWIQHEWRTVFKLKLIYFKVVYLLILSFKIFFIKFIPNEYCVNFFSPTDYQQRDTIKETNVILFCATISPAPVNW